MYACAACGVYALELGNERVEGVPGKHCEGKRMETIIRHTTSLQSWGLTRRRQRQASVEQAAALRMCGYSQNTLRELRSRLTDAEFLQTGGKLVPRQLLALVLWIDSEVGGDRQRHRDRGSNERAAV